MFDTQAVHERIAKRLSILNKPPSTELYVVVNAVRVPLVLLDKDLRVVYANRSFCEALQASPKDVENHPIYELGNGQWDVPRLRELLEGILLGQIQTKNFEVDRECPTKGRRRMLINAHRISRGGKRTPTVLLAIEDVTERLQAEEANQQAHQNLKIAESRIAELLSANEELQREIAERQEAEEENLQTGEDLKRAEERIAELLSANEELQREIAERQKAEEENLQAGEDLKRAEERIAELLSANEELQREIAERQKAEEENLQAGEDLKRAEERIAELQEANEQLQRKIAEGGHAEEALQETQTELKKTKEYLEAITKDSPDAIISTDHEGNVVLFNKGAEVLLGYRAEEILGLSVVKLYESEERAEEVMHQMLEGGGVVSSFETKLRAKDGRFIPVSISASILYDEEGDEAGTVLFNRDLRELKDFERKLEELEVVDTLTKLYKRGFFTAKLEEEFQSAASNDLPLSLVLLDVDHFRTVNDTYGHRAGDAYLDALAGFVVSSVRPSDIVARYGGEEIVIMLPKTPSVGAVAVAKRLQATVAALEVSFGDYTICRTISIGVASYARESVETVDDFLKAVDNALYAAKRNGRNRVVVWSEGWSSLLPNERSED